MIGARNLLRKLVPRGARNWLRSPANSASWLVDECKHRLGADLNAEIRPGWTLRCHPAAYHFGYCSQIKDQEQAREFDSFVARCRPEMILFDVGAHFGIFSLAALHFAGGRAKAVAVDPSPSAVRMIKIQARLNEAADRLTAVQACVGEFEGEQDMVAGGMLSHGYYFAPGSAHSKSELTRARSETLDSLARFSKAAPTHVKIDVEGAEAAVLRGGRRLLSGRKAPLLFVELHNEMVRERQGNPEEALDLLDGFGYSLFLTSGAPAGKTELLGPPVVRIIAEKRA